MGLNETFSPNFNVNLLKLTKDMKFWAWYTIISGGLACLSILGALIGVPQLIAGLRLKDSIDDFEAYLNSGNLENIEHAIEKQMKYYSTMKIIVIASLILVVVILLVVIIFGAFFAKQIMNASQMS
jgi:hypothetical protein